MNCLHRDIEKHEVVVLQSRYLNKKGEIKFHQKLFCCIAGMGMYKDTDPRQTTIQGYFLDIGEPTYVNGLHIDVNRTNAIRKTKDVHDMVKFLNQSFHKSQVEKFWLPEELIKETK